MCRYVCFFQSIYEGGGGGGEMMIIEMKGGTYLLHQCSFWHIYSHLDNMGFVVLPRLIFRGIAKGL